MTACRRPAPTVVLAAAAGLSLVAAGALVASRSAPLALINESRSVPRGLYVRSPDPRLRHGQLVAVGQPQNAQAYLASLGAPAGMRLLKRVAATGGERVCAGGHVLRTPAGALPVLLKDRRGVSLPAWTGCRKLAGDELLVLGDTPTSFDGRYFGPVRRTLVEGPYTEVLGW